ncbi:MAG: hypothetical protein WD045_13625 [Pirellulaceae bacterium]
MSLIKRLWNDEAGFVVSAELILVATILVLGLIVGLTSVRDAVTSELADVTGAINNVNQSYNYFGINGHSGAVAGSVYVDQLDFCDATTDPPGVDNACITHNAAVLEGGTMAPPTGT